MPNDLDRFLFGVVAQRDHQLASPKPMLMVLGELDVCTFTDVQREVFATAGEPKRLVTHPGGHFETYDKYFDISGPAARDWFVEHLTDARRDTLDEVSPSSQ